MAKPKSNHNTPIKRVASTRKTTSRKAQPKKRFRFWKHIMLPIFVIAFLFALWHYKYTIYYFFREKTEKQYEVSLTEEMRIFDVLSKHKNKLHGIDISHYQGVVEWNESLKIQDSFPISFVFIRATAGKDLTDRRFAKNWAAAKEKGITRGAYHYYRPNENSIQQAINFINTVRLTKGDLPPVLDIENIPSTQSIDSLKLGLQRWLTRVENHYGVKPIIYSGESFYNQFLYTDFAEYPVWIANYNYFVEKIERDWLLWQFTDKASITGCKTAVDINVFNGDSLALQQMQIN